MLPDGYQWRKWIEGLALYLGDVQVATVTPVTGGTRTLVNANSVRMRYVFFDAEVAAVRYVEAWASKWDERLRAERAGRAVPNWGAVAPSNRSALR